MTTEATISCASGELVSSCAIVTKPTTISESPPATTRPGANRRASTGATFEPVATATAEGTSQSPASSGESPAPAA